MSHSIRAQIAKWVNAPLESAMFAACLYVWLMSWKFQLILSKRAGGIVFSGKYCLDWVFWEGQSEMVKVSSSGPHFLQHFLLDRTHLPKPPDSFVWGRLVSSDTIFKNSHHLKATVQSRVPDMGLVVLMASLTPSNNCNKNLCVQKK